MENIIAESLKGSIAAKEAFVATQQRKILTLVEWIVDSMKSEGKLLIFGNGGSAADAQHLAAEFVNRFLIDRPPLPAIALTTDSSILTSVGNDFSFEDIFVKQIQALGKRGDIALGISTSGNSLNVITAISEAKKLGLRTAVLTGGSGGKLADLADLALNVPSDRTPHIQEAHIWIEHLLCQLVDETMFGKDRKY
jgi:D-sedoheptulose 7-phosphate isomerase